ncbi:MAG TPA: long-chain-fatty-acid--CoA ligase [Hyphomonadaceae bacterium]|nr:long-chain-fatty-acid--CoA ligase [Hyphomonadaceae bacterium]
MVFGFGKGKQETKAAAPAPTPAPVQAAAKPVAPGVASAAPAAASSIQRGWMPGQMQDWKFTVNKVIEHAHINHGSREVVTRSVEGPIVRSNYSELYWRARKCSNALLADGVQKGDRIATLAWNTQRHIETWYGTMCIGAVLHTLNPRLFPEQIAWIINHAEDTHVFYDITFQPIIEAIKDKVPSVKHWIVLTDAAHKPQSGIANLRTYEEYIGGQSTDVVWGDFPEETACGLCYTSGTTGDPKGVLYSHRSNVMHTMIGLQKDAIGIGAADTTLPVVPMFHANAWGLAFSGPATGSKLVLPGAKMDGESIYELLENEKVTFTAAVPTVWLMLLQYLESTNKKLPHLNRVVIGGSAVPERILRAFEENYQVEVVHAWGMTEMSPLGSLGSMTAGVLEQDHDTIIKYKLKQGRPPFGVEMKIIDDEGKELPHDGKSAGRLVVRGPAISKAYFKNAGGEILDKEGFFDTGDVANIDELGYMQITDRAKDVIKSGGEWISSIDIENFAVGHPAVANAAAIGLPHPKWDERPLLIIELKPGQSASREDLLNYLNGKIAKWWMPDDVVFTDKIPLGATGKINKLALRATFKDHKLPSIQAAE